MFTLRRWRQRVSFAIMARRIAKLERWYGVKRLPRREDENLPHYLYRRTTEIELAKVSRDRRMTT